jgi:hypothetical protein
MTVIIQIIYFTKFLVLSLPNLIQDKTGEPTGITSVQWLTGSVLAGFFLMILLLFYKVGNRIKKSELDKHNYIKTIQSQLNQLQTEVNQIKTVSKGNLSTKADLKSYKAIIERKFEPQDQTGTIEISEKDLMPSNEQSMKTEEDQPSQVIDLEIKKELYKNISYFLGSPDKEKAFYAPEATENPGANTLYVIEEDNTLNLYNKINSQAMKSAMNSVEIHIKRVCEIMNAKEPQHTKIVMLKPGEVTKENEDFLVTNKMKVKFD